jgi:hypothetical protein
MSDFPAFLASQMGVSRRTATRWCAAGKVPGAYRTKGGHWRVRRRRRKYWISDRIAELVFIYTEPPPRALPPPTKRERLEWRFRSLQQRFADQAERLASSPEFNNALEFSKVVAGVTNDDMRDIAQRDLADRRSRLMQLKNRDPEKWNFLFTRRFFEVHPKAYAAIRHRNGELMVKAYKLALNQCAVTAETLARELNISVATLYRRYVAAAVKRARSRPLLCDEPPTEVRYRAKSQ